jgi:hypothetical protein
MGRKPAKITQYLASKILKACTKCGEKKNIDDFYTNKEFEAEMYRDSWCKECSRGFAIDVPTLVEYCKNNKRLYHSGLYENSMQRAEATMMDRDDYKKCKDLVQQQYMLGTQCIKYYFQGMNRSPYYDFLYGDTTEEELTENYEKDVTPEQVEQVAEIGLAFDIGKKTFNKNWHGYFTIGELAYLDEYYNGLARDFKLENQSYIDYAKKVCKASLVMDRAFSDMLEGKQGAEKKYKDFKDIFDALSQSAKFAEKTRSDNDTVGLGSLGELVKRLETTGFLQKKIEFEKDDIDMILDDYRWILTSVGEEF